MLPHFLGSFTERSMVRLKQLRATAGMRVLCALPSFNDMYFFFASVGCICYLHWRWQSPYVTSLLRRCASSFLMVGGVFLFCLTHVYITLSLLLGMMLSMTSFYLRSFKRNNPHSVSPTLCHSSSQQMNLL